MHAEQAKKGIFKRFAALSRSQQFIRIWLLALVVIHLVLLVTCLAYAPLFTAILQANALWWVVPFEFFVALTPILLAKGISSENSKFRDSFWLSEGLAGIITLSALSIVNPTFYNKIPVFNLPFIRNVLLPFSLFIVLFFLVKTSYDKWQPTLCKALNNKSSENVIIALSTTALIYVAGIGAIAQWVPGATQAFSGTFFADLSLADGIWGSDIPTWVFLSFLLVTGCIGLVISAKSHPGLDPVPVEGTGKGDAFDSAPGVFSAAGALPADPDAQPGAREGDESGFAPRHPQSLEIQHT